MTFTRGTRTPGVLCMVEITTMFWEGSPFASMWSSPLTPSPLRENCQRTTPGSHQSKWKSLTARHPLDTTHLLFHLLLRLLLHLLFPRLLRHKVRSPTVWGHRCPVSSLHLDLCHGTRTHPRKKRSLLIFQHAVPLRGLCSRLRLPLRVRLPVDGAVLLLPSPPPRHRHLPPQKPLVFPIMSPSRELPFWCAAPPEEVNA